MNLSPHFTLEELTRTSSGLPNVPGLEARDHLVTLCTRVLEPVREILGVPLRVNSGYRSPQVNAAAHGSPSSQHMLGEAADVVPVGLDVETAMAKIAEAVRAGRISVDQAIVYPLGGFLHLSYSSTRAQRGQLLRSAAAGGSGGPYSPWVAL